MSSSDGQSINWYQRAWAAISNCWGWMMERVSGVSKSIFEVFVTIGFTFFPFFFLSIKWPETQGSNTQSTLSDAFFAYWQAGEIVLPIFGLCGAVAALLALNKGYFSWGVHALVSATILFFAFGGGAALIGSDGFNKTLNPELVTFGFFGYAILAFVWFLLAAKVRTTEPTTRKSDQKARSILDEANARRNKAGNQS